MTLNVPELRKGLRRTTDQSFPQDANGDRRKNKDRRVTAAEPANTKKVRRIWLTPKSKTLIEDLFLLDEK